MEAGKTYIIDTVAGSELDYHGNANTIGADIVPTQVFSGR